MPSVSPQTTRRKMNVVTPRLPANVLADDAAIVQAICRMLARRAVEAIQRRGAKR
ncbi:MAG TPA: hypothetical protein PLD59_04650 [Tepidisphaeraceae bacterium]|nr:hypothetical protein [Tepidisphaeraceae bacterium]